MFLSAGGFRLKCSELLKHVMEVLQSSYSCSAYGEHYSSLLVKDILSVRKYWCDITPEQWHSQWATYLNNEIIVCLIIVHVMTHKDSTVFVLYLYITCCFAQLVTFC